MLLELLLEQSCSRAICGVLCCTFKDAFATGFFHETTEEKCELLLPEYYVAGCNQQIAGSQQIQQLLTQILRRSWSRAICLRSPDSAVRMVSRDGQNTAWQVVTNKWLFVSIWRQAVWWDGKESTLGCTHSWPKSKQGPSEANSSVTLCLTPILLLSFVANSRKPPSPTVARTKTKKILKKRNLHAALPPFDFIHSIYSEQNKRKICVVIARVLRGGLEWANCKEPANSTVAGTNTE